MSHFDNVLKKTNDIMGLKIDDKPKAKHEPLAVKVKHGSSGDASISHDFRVARDLKNNTYSQKHVTAVSRKLNDSTNVKVERSLKDIKVEVDHTPNAMNSKDVNVDLHAEAKIEYGSKNWETEVSTQVAIHEKLPAKTFIDLGVFVNSQGEQVLKNALNFNKDDHNLGVRLEHNGTDLTALWAQYGGVMKGDAWYLRYDHFGKTVSGGCQYKIKEHDHANDVTYDIEGKTKGMFGLPVWWRWGGKYQLQKGIEVHSKLSVLETCDLENIWRLKLNDKVTLLATENVDLCKVLSNPADAMGRVGITFEVKI